MTTFNLTSTHLELKKYKSIKRINRVKNERSLVYIRLMNKRDLEL